jgi:hypothetical protein
MGLNQGQLNQLLGGWSQAANEPYKRAQEQQMHAQDANAKLAELITGKKADQENEAAKLNTQNTLSRDNFDYVQKQAQDASKHGSKITAKLGDASFGDSEAVDPALKMMAGNQKQDLAAGGKAVAIYNRLVPKLQEQHAKLEEGLSAVNDPNQIGSVGAAKSFLISGAAAMNRYNQTEGDALVPPSIVNKMQEMANSFGDDANPLTPQQRQSISFHSTESSGSHTGPACHGAL